VNPDNPANFTSGGQVLLGDRLDLRSALGPPQSALAYDVGCRRCERLVAALEDYQQQQPDYWCRPVAAIGPESAPLLVVGLAPGQQGANRTGRPFSGDQSGVLLHQALVAAGFVWPGEEVAGSACRITNAVKCWPPQNRPTRGEISNCNSYLQAELARLPAGGVVLALGQVAHEAVLLALHQPRTALTFGHGVRGQFDGRWLLSSYHCSRYNIQTRRLTAEAFCAVVAEAAELVRGSATVGNGPRGSGPADE